MRRRAPTYRERWVKNDDSGTLGFYFCKIKRSSNGDCVFFYICDIISAMANFFRHAYGVPTFGVFFV